MLRKERKRRPSYRLRVRAYVEELGYRKMLSIKLKDRKEARAVAKLITRWKAEHLERKMIQRQAAEAQKRARRLVRLEHREERLARRLNCDAALEIRDNFGWDLDELNPLPKRASRTPSVIQVTRMGPTMHATRELRS